MASGDNSALYTAYKRITFEPILLQNGDWVTIGGPFDTASLQNASGSNYNFTTTAISYEITVELSGFNQATDPKYVAYNDPTGISNGGRKNPGFGPNSGIRVEFDDVKLAVTDQLPLVTAIGTVSPKSGPVGTPITITGLAFGTAPKVKFNGTTASSIVVNASGTSITAVVPAGASTGKIEVMGSAGTAISPSTFFISTAANLLADPNFDVGSINEFWTQFNGARLVDSTNTYPDATVSWNETPNSSPYMLIPGWEGSSDAGFMQNQIPFSATAGDYFIASFRAKFDPDYEAAKTLVAFMNASGTGVFKEVDITSEINKYKNQWHTYTARFKASTANLTTMTGGSTTGFMSLKIQPITRSTSLTQSKTVIIDNVVLSQATSAAVGPQLSVKVDGLEQADDTTATLTSPLVKKTTSYAVTLENQGAENLIISSISPGGSGFSLVGTGTGTLAPGDSTTITVTTTPSAIGAVAGSLTIVSNDKEASDQTYVVNLSTSAVNLMDDFSSGTPSSLGWVTESKNVDTSSTTSVSGGSLVMDVTANSYPWKYQVSKTFASPGSLDTTTLALLAELKASGIYEGGTQIKVEIRLESFND